MAARKLLRLHRAVKRDTLERFPIGWNRSRFHPIGNARTGDRDFTGHIPSGWFQPNGMCS